MNSTPPLSCVPTQALSRIIGDMKQLDLNSGNVRAAITFVLIFALLKLLFWLLSQSLDINFYAETLLVLIGAGWSAYWIWKKTEFGYY